jgi:phosphoglycolate phosphatase
VGASRVLAQPPPPRPLPQGEGESSVPSVLLYDWDNTLVDGWAGIAGALNVVFAEFAMPNWTVADAKQRVRTSLRDGFSALFGSEWERARDLFYAALTEQHLRHVTPMPGAAEALTAGAAWPQGVVSNKIGQFLRAEVVHLGWTAHFGTVIGAGDAAADKPDAAPIWLALEQLGHPADGSVWYLGDTALDMQAARAAGVTAVLIGDASHDGGIDRSHPDIHFPSALDLAARLRALAREGVVPK